MVTDNRCRILFYINPYFSDYVTLLGAITHGLWSSATTRRYVKNVVAQGHPD